MRRFNDGLNYYERKARRLANAPARAAEKARRAALPPSTCQICGRPILSETGVIAHHGYKRPGYGWQTSSCLGARYPRYEASRDRIPYVIEIVKNHIERTIAHLEDLRTNPPATLMLEKSKWNYKTHKNETEIVDVPKPADLELGSETFAARARIFGTFEYLYGRMIADVERDLRDSRSTLEFLENRFKTWKAPAA